MGRFGGFYKGEKRKKKKNLDKDFSQSSLSASIFTPPKIISKKKKQE